MTKNISNILDIDKVTNALALRLPYMEGPWKYKKTSIGQSNPTFILTGKNKAGRATLFALCFPICRIP